MFKVLYLDHMLHRTKQIPFHISKISWAHTQYLVGEVGDARDGGANATRPSSVTSSSAHGPYGRRSSAIPRMLTSLQLLNKARPVERRRHFLFFLSLSLSPSPYCALTGCPSTKRPRFLRSRSDHIERNLPQPPNYAKLTCTHHNYVVLRSGGFCGVGRFQSRARNR